MTGDSNVNFTVLHRTCKLVVLLCLLHISVTLVFYLRSFDIRLAFVQNQQSHKPKDLTTSKILKDVELTEQDSVQPRKVSGVVDVANVSEEIKILGNCPETSPLLGKYYFALGL